MAAAGGPPLALPPPPQPGAPTAGPAAVAPRPKEASGRGRQPGGDRRGSGGATPEAAADVEEEAPPAEGSVEEEELLDEIDVERDAAEPEVRPGGWRQRIKRYAGAGVPRGEQLRSMHSMMRSKDSDNRPTEDKIRTWELQLSIRSMEYVGGDSTIDTFFAVSLLPVEGAKFWHGKRVRLLPEYSPACILEKNKQRVLGSPYSLWDRKVFQMSYKDLEKYILKVAMWKVSPMTFNSYYGKGERTLAKIVRNEANIQFPVKEKLTKEAEDRKKKKKLAISDVAMLGCNINLEEIFDFQLAFENWSLELKEAFEKKKRLEQKCLTFVVPKNKLSDASLNRKCHVRTVKWKGPEKDEKLIWPALGDNFKYFRFRGTPTALQNQFVIVKVHSTQTQLGDRHPTVPATLMSPGTCIGCALMNLTSILDISVFKGNVKDLRPEKERFYVGVVNGSIKAIKCSMGYLQPEDIKGGRPQQPKTAATVGHLRPKEQHLVLRVLKCDNLAVADIDTGASDPYLRTTWDNMVQKSPILKETVRPVFNFNFFFPVRLFNIKLLQPRNEEALRLELHSKGDIVIQVWDDDDTSADSLGNVRVPLIKLINSRNRKMRTLLGPSHIQKAKEDEEGPKKVKQQWFEVEKEVRLYDGMKTELKGCNLPNPNTALIYFEAYFYPDWPEFLDLHEDHDNEEGKSKWEEKEMDFYRSGTEFARQYADVFPDSIGARPCHSEAFRRIANLRRFNCMAKHPQTMENLPLMAFLCNIITPDEYTKPMELMHWISCITFSNTSRQEREGCVPEDGWKDPQTFLFTRKGPVQDHALLLCSVLLGAKKDAYVCKGTVWVKDQEGNPTSSQRLVEHTWVMTRERKNWVTFWEPCQREIYHMPERWKSKRGNKTAPPQEEGALADDRVNGEEEDEDADDKGGALHEVWHNEIPDMTLGLEDIEALPTVGRMPRAKQRAEKNKDRPRDKMKEELAKEQSKRRVAPRNDLLAEGRLVDWLPYDSIDVVFNTDNVWANRQNHHPACITYNWEPDETAEEGKEPEWEPLLSKEEKQMKEFAVTPINSEVVIDPALTADKLEVRESQMILEMEENMRVFRGKFGMDTFFEKSEKLCAELREFLDILERMRKLDLDFFPRNFEDYEDWEPDLRAALALRCGVPNPGKEDILKMRYNKWGSAFHPDVNDRYKQYEKEQRTRWNEVAKELAAMRKKERKDKFPAHKGKVFKGFPAHFCTSDKEEVRGYLMNMKEYKEIIQDDTEGIAFTVYCKMFPLIGGVQSTWLYFGAQRPMVESDVAAKKKEEEDVANGRRGQAAAPVAPRLNGRAPRAPAAAPATRGAGAAVEAA